MVNLKENTLLREIPANILVDKKVIRVAQSLQPSLDRMVEWLDKMNYTTNLEKLDDAILEHLLWEKHITWNEGLNLATTREQKINLINAAVDLHRYKGTAYAIERVLGALKIKGEVLEWWEYNADPYHFNVELEVMRYIKDLKEVEVLILEYKNVRSYFDGFVMVLGSKNILLIDDTYDYQVIFPYHPYGEKEFTLLNSENIKAVDNSYDYIVDYPASEKIAGIVTGENATLLNDTYDYLKSFPETGVMETLDKQVSLQIGEALTKNEQYEYPVRFEVTERQSGVIEGDSVKNYEDVYTYPKRFVEAGDLLPLDKTVSTQISSAFTNQETYDFKKIHAVCGEFVAGGEI